MKLASGQRFGSYEIQATLGAGGMGEVYRARDSKLNRDVALKILPEALAADPERLARFRREAQVLAVLNHPNIAAIYGIEDFEGHQALVMELVPGRTLAEILEADGALAPDAAVHIASQIAEALEAAHESGIVHRDLKPANIKRRDDDVVKVLDFGLAKGLADDMPDTMSSPTMLSPAVTQHGVILGTAAYMSPEQAKGRSVDKRADIWAFGVVLFEMLTGQRLFGGETITETIASVIKDPPRLDALPPGTPPVLRRLLARCLERDPKLRLRDVGEARIMLRSALDPLKVDASVAVPAPVAAGPVRRVAVRIAVATGALALAGAAALAAWRAKPDTPVPVRRLDLPAAIATSRDLGLAPDGNRVAYLADGHLYVRALDARQAADLGAVPPASHEIFWSPDGRSIGYAAESTIRTVPSTGGPTFTVGRIPASGRIMGGAWREDGTIFIAVWRDSLYRVSATGGTPAVHAAIDPATEIDFHAVALLPGNRLALTTHLRADEGTRLDLVDGDRRTPLATEPDLGSVRFIPPNQILFVRTRTNPGAWVVPLEGSAVDLSKAVLVEPGVVFADVSRDGTMIGALPAKVRRELVWVDRAGAVTPVPGPPVESPSPIPTVALSPDGRRAAVAVRTSDFKDSVIVRELSTGADTRVPLPEPNSRSAPTPPTWTPSGRLLLTLGGVEASKIFDWPADGSSNGRPLVTGLSPRLSRDGRELLFLVDERGLSRLRRAPVLADGSVGKAEPVFRGDNEPRVRSFDLSPDGRLLVFAAPEDDTQQLNLFVTPYPDARERRQVTSEGGSQPRFSRDGSELFYTSGTRAPGGFTRGRLDVVSLKSTPVTIGAPRTILAEGEAGQRGPTLSGFDVAADGRLIMTRVVPSAPGDEARLILLQNWPASIRK